MDEKDFEVLRVLDESRNITRAAERLYMTQSALSKRIKAIEADLGTELVLRSRLGVRFTPAGEAALEYCNLASREMDQLRRDINLLSGEVCGTLKAGISENYALYRLPDALAAYHHKYPKVRLQITTGRSQNLYRQMLDGTLDVAVLRGEYPWDGVQYLLAQESVCLIFNQEYKNKPLSDYLYISHRTDSIQAAMVLRWLHEQGLSTQPAGFCVDSVTACVAMVKRGLGWGILPEIALDGFNGCIRPCTFENGEPFVRRSYLLCQRDAAELPQVKAFMEIIKRHN